MPEPVYLVLNGPHRGKRYPAIAGETLALPDYDSLDSFPATTTVIYTLRVLAVDDPDGTGAVRLDRLLAHLESLE
jgi:hypothetical protein